MKNHVYSLMLIVFVALSTHTYSQDLMWMQQKCPVNNAGCIELPVKTADGSFVLLLPYQSIEVRQVVEVNGHLYLRVAILMNRCGRLHFIYRDYELRSTGREI